MANTLGDLKTRIITETNRDDLGSGGDLEAQFILSITRAIEYYADEPFWFNHYGATTTATAATSAGVDYVAIPATIRVPQKLSYLQEDLLKVDLADIEALTDAGQPTRWAASGDNIALWPVPDAVYTLSVFGIAKVAIPATDGDSNVWTTEAQDLIAARTRFLLFRDVFRDDGGVQYAAQAEGEALSRLRQETRRRGMTPLRSDLPARTVFNINRGY